VIAALAHDVESAIIIVKSILVLKNLKLNLIFHFQTLTTNCACIGFQPSRNVQTIAKREQHLTQIAM